MLHCSRMSLEPTTEKMESVSGPFIKWSSRKTIKRETRLPESCLNPRAYSLRRELNIAQHTNLASCYIVFSSCCCPRLCTFQQGWSDHSFVNISLDLKKKIPAACLLLQCNTFSQRCFAAGLSILLLFYSRIIYTIIVLQQDYLYYRCFAQDYLYYRCFTAGLSTLSLFYSMIIYTIIVLQQDYLYYRCFAAGLSILSLFYSRIIYTIVVLQQDYRCFAAGLSILSFQCLINNQGRSLKKKTELLC